MASSNNGKEKARPSKIRYTSDRRRSALLREERRLEFTEHRTSEERDNEKQT